MKNYVSAILISLMVASLLIFLVVIEAYPADITLGWEAPTTNMDGSDLTDLAGYTLYRGDKNGMPVTIDVSNILTYKALNVVEGECFTITAFDTSGNESLPSNQVCIGIPPKAPVMECVTSICNQCIINKCQK